MNEPDDISLPPARPHRFTTVETARVLAIIGDKTEIPADFAGISEEDAVELITILEGVSESEARVRLAFARGETTGDIIELPDPTVIKP